MLSCFGPTHPPPGKTALACDFVSGVFELLDSVAELERRVS